MDEGEDMTYFDLGPYSRTVTTSAPEAQLWFDRGLNWLFGFNHVEAIKCFQRALKYEPECAMAHWGVSYASGPNYNLPSMEAVMPLSFAPSKRSSWRVTRQIATTFPLWLMRTIVLLPRLAT